MKRLTVLLAILTFGTILFAQNETYKLNEVYAMDANGTIKLSTDDADVTITGSDRKDVHVKVFRQVTTKGFTWGDQKFEVRVTPTNNGLTISDKTTGSGVSIVGYMREEYKIEIIAPKGASLKIHGDDDNYAITNINGSIEMRIDDGDAVLKECKGDNFNFNLDDGNITMDRARGKLYARADDGDIKINNADFSDIDVTMDDGDLVLQTSLADNGEYYFKANDADIILDITKGGGRFNIRHDDTRISTSGDFNVVEKDESETLLKTSAGSAIVKMRTDDGRIRITSN